MSEQPTTRAGSAQLHTLAVHITEVCRSARRCRPGDRGNAAEERIAAITFARVSASRAISAQGRTAQRRGSNATSLGPS